MEKQAIAKFLETDINNIKLENYDHSGLRVYSHGKKEYAIGTDQEVEKACQEYIKESLWTFNANFIAEHTKCGYSPELVSSIIKIQELYEGSQPMIELLIENIKEFIDDAISADGRGHFLSPYDGEEIEFDEYFIYRLN